MANETYVTIRGNVGADPVLHEGLNGCATRFTVAVASAKFNTSTGTFEQEPPQWFTVKAFGTLARNVADSVSKGTPVLVRGELVTEYWTDQDSQRRSRQVLRADAIGIELHNGRADFRRRATNTALAQEADARTESFTRLSSPGTDAAAMS